MNRNRQSKGSSPPASSSSAVQKKKTLYEVCEADLQCMNPSCEYIHSTFNTKSPASLSSSSSSSSTTATATATAPQAVGSESGVDGEQDKKKSRFKMGLNPAAKPFSPVSVTVPISNSQAVNLPEQFTASSSSHYWAFGNPNSGSTPDSASSSSSSSSSPALSMISNQSNEYPISSMMNLYPYPYPYPQSQSHPYHAIAPGSNHDGNAEGFYAQSANDGGMDESFGTYEDLAASILPIDAVPVRDPASGLVQLKYKIDLDDGSPFLFDRYEEAVEFANMVLGAGAFADGPGGYIDDNDDADDDNNDDDHHHQYGHRQA
eukprot:ANDGO_08248.mRNA.1 hypothetical protein